MSADPSFWDYTMRYGPAGSEYYAASQAYNYATGAVVDQPAAADGTPAPAPSSAASSFGASMGAGVGKGLGDALGTILIGGAVILAGVVVVAGVGTAVYFGPEIAAALGTAQKVKKKAA